MYTALQKDISSINYLFSNSIIRYSFIYEYFVLYYVSVLRIWVKKSPYLLTPSPMREIWHKVRFLWEGYSALQNGALRMEQKIKIVSSKKDSLDENRTLMAARECKGSCQSIYFWKLWLFFFFFISFHGNAGTWVLLVFYVRILLNLSILLIC